MAIEFEISMTNEYPTGGGWEEDHTVSCLTSADHALDTLKSILFLHDVYKDGAALSYIIIYCTDVKTVIKFEDYLTTRNMSYDIVFVKNLFEKEEVISFTNKKFA